MIVVSRPADFLFIVIPYLGNADSSGRTNYGNVANDLSTVVARNVDDLTTMAASGQKRPLNSKQILSCERLLSGVERPLATHIMGSDNRERSPA